MKIFVISLPDDKDRREYISAQFLKSSIPFSFFDAIDGSNENNPVLKHHDPVMRSWLRGKPESKGAIGCYASHYLLWEKCIELGENILIVEDDVFLGPSFTKLWTAGDFERLLNKYGYLRLEPQKGKSIHVAQLVNASIVKYYKNENDATAYGVSPDAAQKLVAHSEVWIAAVDNYIGQFYLHGVEAYGLSPSCMSKSDEFETNIQVEKNSVKVPFYKKITKEIYTGWRKYKYWRHNSQFEKKLSSREN